MRERLVAIDGALDRPSGTVSAEVAARLLGTSPATLHLWEERFGYPEPTGDGDAGPRYSYAAVIALREGPGSRALGRGGGRRGDPGDLAGSPPRGAALAAPSSRGETDPAPISVMDVTDRAGTRDRARRYRSRPDGVISCSGAPRR